MIAKPRRDKARVSRRVALGALGAGFVLGAVRYCAPIALRAGPVREVTGPTRALVDRCFADVDREKLWDVHTHVVGLGLGSRCWVNPEMRSALHPVKQLQFDVYLAASGIEEGPRADLEYVERLLALHRAANPRGKLLAMAFDLVVDERGREVRHASELYTPNEHVLAIARDHDDVRACASIHPYRADAVERLDRVAEQGAVAIKWLPNAMQIDPASPRCDAFYQRMAELRIPLISHTGEEKAVDAETSQALGNPLKLRRALDAGVTVVAAHCASLGDDVDLDDASRPRVPSFDLFMRMLRERQYEATLFGEISAMTQANRCGRPLRELLSAPELHPRLVNGSDYPLPAIDPLIRTGLLVDEGYVTEDERELVNEVFTANPLLFDYVLKRCLRVGEHAFLPIVFETSRLFDV